MFIVGFRMCPLIVWAMFCLYPSCWGFYDDKMLDFFQMLSLHLRWPNYVSPSFLLRQEAYWFVYVRRPYFSGRNSDKARRGLTMCWHLWFGSALLRSSASVFIRYTGLEFCLRAVSLSASHSRVMLVSDNEFRNVPAFNFSKSLRHRINSSLNVSWNSTVKSSYLGPLGWEFGFPIQPLCSSLLCSEFLFLSVLVLAGCTFLGI